ncbi:MAG: hypothetical protein JWP85_1975 [Rhodoglobus sp.]|nr:hypothetical protein [Rhodoglobus sp.]
MAVDRAESVGGGALTSLISVPVGVGLSAVPVPLDWLGLYGAVVVTALPFLARWLYTRASGGYLVVGKPVFGGVVALALIATSVASVLFLARRVFDEYYTQGESFTEVLFGSFTSNYYFGYGTPEDLIFSLIVAVFVGGGSLLFVLLSAPKPPIRPIAG